MSILNLIRDASIDKDTFDEFKRRITEDIQFCPENETLQSKTIRIFATRKEVDNYNRLELAKINLPSIVYCSIDNGDYNLFKQCPMPRQIELKKGCPVILTMNLNEKLYNGVEGVVEEFVQNNDPVVYFPHLNESHKIGRVDWSLELNKTIVAKRIQIPLMVAFAITIHKSQGMTLESVSIDAGKIFAPGQLYVALSRVKSIYRLDIKNLSYDQIHADRSVVDFYLSQKRFLRE